MLNLKLNLRHGPCLVDLPPIDCHGVWLYMRMLRSYGNLEKRSLSESGKFGPFFLNGKS